MVAVGLGGLEDLLHVLDRAVLGDTGADRSPVRTLQAQHIILWVDEHDCGVGLLNVHGDEPFASVLGAAEPGVLRDRKAAPLMLDRTGPPSPSGK